MSVRIYTSREVQMVMDSGSIAYETHMHLKDLIRPGLTTAELDKAGRSFMEKKGSIPAFLGLYGFPASIITSVNDSVVHGIPSEKQVLQEGDIVSIDLGVKYKGYYSDTAWTWPVGEISPEARRLMEVTQQSLFLGIQAATQGNRIGAISESVQKYVESNGYSVVRALVGHGVGKAPHEEPQIPNFGHRKDGVKIRPGMILAIEPMVNQGKFEVYTDSDKWNIKTKDGKLSAHYEHTVIVTSNGPLIATLPKGAEINVFKLIGQE